MDKPLQSLRKSVRGNREKYALVPTKNSKERYLTVAPFVVGLLKKEEAKQDANRKDFEGLYEESASEIWNNPNLKSGELQKEAPGFRGWFG